MTTFTSAEEMESEALSRLISKLNNISEADEDALSVIVKDAVETVETIRNYPSSYSEEDIWADMSRYFSNVCDLAMYDFNQMGVEGETSHSENGVSRVYKSRGSCLYGVRPISRTI